MKNKNHMKIFPPQLQLLLCLNQFKQNKIISDEKVFSILHFLEVEKLSLKFIIKEIGDINPEENTSGRIEMPLYLNNINLKQEFTEIEKTRSIQKSTLQLFKNIISTFRFKAKLEFDSCLVVRIH